MDRRGGGSDETNTVCAAYILTFSLHYSRQHQLHRDHVENFHCTIPQLPPITSQHVALIPL